MKTKLAKKQIVGKNSEVLRQIAAPVPLEEIGSKKISRILTQMADALHSQEDGVAIAAPQIGESLRIFIVSGGAIDFAKGRSELDEPSKDLIFINPEITKVSRKSKEMEEGCLSVRWLYGDVKRHDKITITAYDESGIKNSFSATGLISQIFQHEIDHLNGILFIDKAENIRDLPPKRNGE